MRFLIASISLSLLTSSAQAINLPGQVPCPVIANVKSGTYTVPPKSKKNTICFKSQKAAKTQGFLLAGSNNVVDNKCILSQLSEPESADGFLIAGQGGSASPVFEVTQLPATVSFTACNTASKNRSFKVRYRKSDTGTSSGTVISESIAASDGKTNTYLINEIGSFYLEILTDNPVKWRIKTEAE